MPIRVGSEKRWDIAGNDNKALGVSVRCKQRNECATAVEIYAIQWYEPAPVRQLGGFVLDAEREREKLIPVCAIVPGPVSFPHFPDAQPRSDDPR